MTMKLGENPINHQSYTSRSTLTFQIADMQWYEKHSYCSLCEIKRSFSISLFLKYFFPRLIHPRSNENNFLHSKVGFDALLSGINQYLVSSCRMSRSWVLRVIRQFELTCAYAPGNLDKLIEYKEADLNIKREIHNFPVFFLFSI